MEYVFGTRDDDQVILKTVGTEHSELTGWHELERKYPDQTITDHFLILEKYDSAEDAEGNCYDWYSIDRHYRFTDRTGPVKEALSVTREELESALAELGELFAEQDDALVELAELIGG